MSKQRFTAANTGWYRLVPGSDPKYLGTEQPEGWPPDSAAVIYMDSDTIMNSDGTWAPPEEPSLVIPWDHE